MDDETNAGNAAAWTQLVLTILGGGRRTASYKLAVLLALIAGCALSADAQGRAPSRIGVRELAARVLEKHAGTLLCAALSPDCPRSRTRRDVQLLRQDPLYIGRKPVTGARQAPHGVSRRPDLELGLSAHPSCACQLSTLGVRQNRAVSLRLAAPSPALDDQLQPLVLPQLSHT